MPFYRRREGDGPPDKYTFSFINGNIDIAGLRHLVEAVATANNALPAPGAVVQQFVPPERSAAITVVCAGTIQKIGDSFGVLKDDTVAGDLGTFFIEGRFRFLMDSSGVAGNGLDAYIILADMDVT